MRTTSDAPGRSLVTAAGVHTLSATDYHAELRQEISETWRDLCRLMEANEPVSEAARWEAIGRHAGVLKRLADEWAIKERDV